MPQADIVCNLQRDIFAHNGTYRDLYTVLGASDAASTDDLMVAFLAMTAEGTSTQKIRRRCFAKVQEEGLDDMQVIRGQHGDPERTRGVMGWFRQLMGRGPAEIDRPRECTSRRFMHAQNEHILLQRALDVLTEWSEPYKAIFGDILRKPLKQASRELEKVCPSTKKGQKK